jgi:hypothetical protein
VDNVSLRLRNYTADLKEGLIGRDVLFMFFRQLQVAKGALRLSCIGIDDNTMQNTKLGVLDAKFIRGVLEMCLVKGLGQLFGSNYIDSLTVSAIFVQYHGP